MSAVYVPPKVPSVTLREITDTGRVILTFSEDMYVQPDLALLLKETNVTDWSGVTRPFLEINEKIGYYSPEEKLGYSWEIVLMTARSLEIQLNFENPIYVSMSEEPEVLEIQINSGQIFFST